MLTLFNRRIWVFKIICNDIVDALPGIKANWTCQRQQKHGFSSSACDQVMEQTFNRDSKTKGGLTGFTLNKSAVQRWILAQSERGSITRQCYSLAGFITSDRYGIVEPIYRILAYCRD